MDALFANPQARQPAFTGWLVITLRGFEGGERNFKTCSRLLAGFVFIANGSIQALRSL
jgi:hypothetical protein